MLNFCGVGSVVNWDGAGSIFHTVKFFLICRLRFDDCLSTASIVIGTNFSCKFLNVVLKSW